MNIQRKNSAHHFRMQSEREQTLGMCPWTHLSKLKTVHVNIFHFYPKRVALTSPINKMSTVQRTHYVPIT